MALPRIVVALAGLLVAGALGAVAWPLAGGASTGHAGASLADVNEDPQHYEGTTVTVSGRIGRSRYLSLADAQIALLIEDGRGRRVLVLSQRAALPAELGRDDVLRVTGRVWVPGRSPAPAAAGYISLGRLLARSGAGAVLLAHDITRVRGYRATGRSARPTTVARLLRAGRDAHDDPVSVAGTVHRITAAGFILAGRRRTIFVGARPDALERLRPGARVRVGAELARMSRFRAATIARALVGTRRAGAAERDGADLGRTPLGRGRRFLVLRSIAQG